MQLENSPKAQSPHGLRKGGRLSGCASGTADRQRRTEAGQRRRLRYRPAQEPGQNRAGMHRELSKQESSCHIAGGAEGSRKAEVQALSGIDALSADCIQKRLLQQQNQIGQQVDHRDSGYVPVEEKHQQKGTDQ